MELTDLQIAAGLKKKDAAVYEYIIGRYGKQVYYLAYNIMRGTGTAQDIEECAADVFFKAWTDIAKFDTEKGSFKTWLFILAKYRALEYRRRLSKNPMTELDELFADGSQDVERRVIARQSQEKVLDVINGFNDIDKELFIRRYFYNEKINDLMAALNLTRPAIDNRLLRGRKLIKEAFAYD